MSEIYGTVTQVIGPVIDVSFEGGKENIPPIYSALKVERDNGGGADPRSRAAHRRGHRPLRGHGKYRRRAPRREGEKP